MKANNPSERQGKPIYICINCGDRGYSYREFCTNCNSPEKRRAMAEANDKIRVAGGLSAVYVDRLNRKQPVHAPNV